MRQAFWEDSMSFNRVVKLAAGAAVLALSLGSAKAADNVEVLHWWTSGGEAAALDVLKKDLELKGVTWADMPVAGGGGEAAMTALRARVTAANPPTAVQALGFDITDWAKQGVVGDLSEVATARRAGTRSSRPRCRISPSMMASGSLPRSMCTRPTGSGSPRKRWMRQAARRRRTGTSSWRCSTRSRQMA